MQAPRGLIFGGAIQRRGFLRNRFTQYLEGLIHGGAYFRNFTVAKCCVAYKLIKGEVPLYIEDSLRLKSQQPSRVTGCSNINFICPKSNRVSEGGRTFAVTTC